MAENFLESYLVRLGFNADLPSYRKFDDVLRLAEGSVEHHVHGITETVLKMQAGLLGGFLSLSGAIATMADKVAMADQGYRLMGLRMMMTTESARKLSMITEGLGASLDQIVWDPELHRRALIMSADIDRLTEQLGPNFEKNMLHIRDLRFEFTRLGVELKFLGMGFVSDLFEKLGINIKTVSGWVDKFGENLPQLANKLSTDAVPVLKDTWTMFKELGAALKEFGVLFTNVIGLLSGDHSIEGAAFSFDKLAKSIEHVLQWGADLFHWITQAESMLAHFADAGSLLISGHFSQAAKEFRSGLGELNPGSGTVAGAVTGGIAGPVAGTIIGGLVGGPAGAIAGGLAGHMLGPLLGGALGFGAGELREHLAPNIAHDTHSVSAAETTPLMARAWHVAQEVGVIAHVSPKLVFEQFQHETGNFTNRGARELHNFAGINVPGGNGQDYRKFASDDAMAKYLGHLYSSSRYAGLSQAQTIEQFAEVLHRGGYFTDSLANYVGGMQRFANADTDLFARLQQPATIAPVPRSINHTQQVTIHAPITITQPGADAQTIRRTVGDTIRDALRAQTQTDLAQLAPAW